MNTTSAAPRPLVAESLADSHSQSAVAWGAIFAGAAAAAALSLILLILGTGLGMSSVSPWAYEGISREAFGWSTIAWITVTSIVASGLGGYLAGRLRTKWSAIHAVETYFRDTAHGFLAWAVATLITAAALTSTIGAVLGTGAKAVGSATGAAATTAGTPWPPQEPPPICPKVTSSIGLNRFFGAMRSLPRRQRQTPRTPRQGRVTPLE